MLFYKTQRAKYIEIESTKVLNLVIRDYKRVYEARYTPTLSQVVSQAIGGIPMSQQQGPQKNTNSSNI